MEYLEGEPLDEVMQRRGRFPPAEAARIIFHALQGLQHIHEQRLVHRDLNPGNLMLVPAPGQGDTSKCTVKILDIGLGREIFDEAASVKQGVRLTTAGVLLGTPEYMSPEQGRDARAVDIRSDIYSLGCVLYRLISGQSVFPDTNAISQMIRHATEEPRPLKEFNPAVPSGLQQVVSMMLAKEAAKRHATPAQAAEALRTCLSSGAEVGGRAEPSPQMRNFLTWLEKEDKKPVEAPKPAAEALRAGNGGPRKGASDKPSRAVARAAAKAAARATARKMLEARRAKKKLAKSQAQMPAVAAPAPVATAQAAPIEPDVQLVPVAPPTTPSVLRITWRDFLMFTLGVLGSLAAVGLAYLLARLLA
jgi:serine/threonine-protein kinase